jgi:hypothetical protein
MVYLSVLVNFQDVASAPPSGAVSAVSWVIIVSLVAALVSVTTALWFRGNKIQDQMYEDLKECNEKRAKTEEDVLGLMKVLRLQMEASRGGKKG